MGRAPERLEGTIEPEPRIDLLRELVGSRDDRLQRGADIFVTMALAARERTGVAPQKGKMRCELLSKRHDLRNLLAKALLLRSEEHTSELQSLMRISYAVFCLKKKTT